MTFRKNLFTLLVNSTNMVVQMQQNYSKNNYIFKKEICMIFAKTYFSQYIFCQKQKRKYFFQKKYFFFNLVLQQMNN